MDCLILPFTRQVNQSFGWEPSPVPFYAFFVFFAVDRNCRFWGDGFERALLLLFLCTAIMEFVRRLRGFLVTTQKTDRIMAGTESYGAKPEPLLAGP